MHKNAVILGKIVQSLYLLQSLVRETGNESQVHIAYPVMKNKYNKYMWKTHAFLSVAYIIGLKIVTNSNESEYSNVRYATLHSLFLLNILLK